MAGQARRTGDNVAPWRRLSGQLPAAKADSTPRASRAVPHPSTDRALCRLTSEVRRDPVHSTRYGRQRQSVQFCNLRRQRRVVTSSKAGPLLALSLSLSRTRTYHLSSCDSSCCLAGLLESCDCRCLPSFSAYCEPPLWSEFFRGFILVASPYSLALSFSL